MAQRKPSSVNPIWNAEMMQSNMNLRNACRFVGCKIICNVSRSLSYHNYTTLKKYNTCFNNFFSLHHFFFKHHFFIISFSVFLSRSLYMFPFSLIQLPIMHLYIFYECDIQVIYLIIDIFDRYCHHIPLHSLPIHLPRF